MKLRILRFISVIFAALIALSTATRADELIDLVAAIAPFVDVDGSLDSISVDSLDMDRIYRAMLAGQKHKDIVVFEGVYRAMKRQRAKEFLGETDKEIFQPDYEELFDLWSPGFESRDFYRPVPGKITSYVGWRPQFHRMHHGVDMSLCVGDTVRAAVSGTVETIAYDRDGYGNYVVMSHPGGMETIYGHLLYALVTEGEFIYSGQPLAIGGNTGNSTGPHLHFEVRIDNLPVDPTLVFDFFGTDRYITDAAEPVRNKMPVYTHQAKSLAKESTYIVRYGDTLQSIARQAGISVMRLCQLNMLQESSPLEIGRMLKIR